MLTIVCLRFQINNDAVLDFGECYTGILAEQMLVLKNTLDVPMVCALVWSLHWPLLFVSQDDPAGRDRV